MSSPEERKEEALDESAELGREILSYPNGRDGWICRSCGEVNMRNFYQPPCPMCDDPMVRTTVYNRFKRASLKQLRREQRDQDRREEEEGGA